ncbi:MAG TPA: response regulator transcription factor [Nocardioides sp.]|jgi:DNA-binding NarL/FixJ family response regulator|uniref:response regulator transcription factor n=1 Tax=Nocardioides sp. TaxID=35761 RepID=UPI002E33DCFB|nr:response regulator transcription factor [Nocardioides sp.]HEX3930119.1 response regulator transcription factor [Nocardioides sp.]
MSDPIRVLIVDDHDLVRAGLVGVLSGEKGFQVVAEAADGKQALEAALRHRPDVVVMDLEMPRMGGVAATREILRALPETGVVVLTMYDDDDSVLAALRAGARGYLLKGAGRGELRSAVVAAAEGHSVFGGAVAAKVVGRATIDPAGPAIPGLTKREHDVLAAMADGLSPAAIGVRLDVSPKTARNNISMILTKLGVNDRSEAVALARRAGLGSRG